MVQFIVKEFPNQDPVVLCRVVTYYSVCLQSGRTPPLLNCINSGGAWWVLGNTHLPTTAETRVQLRAVTAFVLGLIERNGLLYEPGACGDGIRGLGGTSLMSLHAIRPPAEAVKRSGWRHYWGGHTLPKPVSCDEKKNVKIYKSRQEAVFMTHTWVRPPGGKTYYVSAL